MVGAWLALGDAKLRAQEGATDFRDEIEVLSPPRRAFKPWRYMELLRRRG